MKMGNLSSVCVFCGSSPGARPEYAAAARKLGVVLAERGVRLVYGGGSVGLMGEVARAAADSGGAVTGVIPRSMMSKEIALTELADLRVVASMHERKALMAELSDAFVALPGGFGTFEELFEVITWGQLGLHRKPFGFLDVLGYYDKLAAFLDHSTEEGFIKPAHRAMVLLRNEPEALLDAMAQYEPPPAPKWINLETA